MAASILTFESGIGYRCRVVMISSLAEAARMDWNMTRHSQMSLGSNVLAGTRPMVTLSPGEGVGPRYETLGLSVLESRIAKEDTLD